MTSERWQKFPLREQMLFVGSELMRAKVWQEKNEKKFKGAIERALALLDLTLEDKRFRDKLPALLFLRQELAEFYTGRKKEDIGFIYKAL